MGYCKGFLTRLLVSTHAPFLSIFNMAASMTLLKHKVDCISPLMRTFPPHLEWSPSPSNALRGNGLPVKVLTSSLLVLRILSCSALFFIPLCVFMFALLSPGDSLPPDTCMSFSSILHIFIEMAGFHQPHYLNWNPLPHLTHSLHFSSSHLSPLNAMSFCICLIYCPSPCKTP